MNATVMHGLQTYGGKLADAGGHAVRAMQQHSDALAVVMYASPPYDMTLPPLDVARLSINLSPAKVAGGLDGEPAQEFLARRHSVFLTPAGAGAAWRKSASSRHINIYFHAQAFEHPEDSAWGPLLGQHEPLLNAGMTGAGAMFDMLAAELAEDEEGQEGHQGQPFGAEAVDSLARLILVRLARKQATGPVRANPLTPAIQARLTDHIQARLDQRLMVSDLAAVAGMSPNRFAQAFTQATGQSPHQHVLRLRLEHAVQLLQHSTQPVADIAAACGFASQQHLTRVMRCRLGSTPGRWRAARAGVDRPPR